MHPSNKGGEKLLSPKFQTQAPPPTPEMSWDSQTQTQDTKAVQQETMLHCAGTASVDSSPKAEPQEQRDLTLYTLTSRLQKQKARFSPCMVTFNSTD
jgi:hypothetical protein